MNNERQPLLLNHDTIPRPDIRDSPENIILDGNEIESSDGKFQISKNKQTNICITIF